MRFSQDSGLGPTVVIDTAERPVAVALSKLDHGVLRLAPTVVPTPMIATAMAATSTPYSMAVDPESLGMKLMMNFRIGVALVCKLTGEGSGRSRPACTKPRSGLVPYA